MFGCRKYKNILHLFIFFAEVTSVTSDADDEEDHFVEAFASDVDEELISMMCASW